MRREVRYGDRLVDSRVVGCTPEYAEVTRLEVDRGHFITDAELKVKQNVCVLAARIVERLFPYEDPIGRRIYLQEHDDYYRVVGVSSRNAVPRRPSAGRWKPKSSPTTSYIPISTLRGRIGDTVVVRRSGAREGETIELNQITLRVDGIHNVQRTAELVERTLAPHHGKVQDVAVVVPLELLEQARSHTDHVHGLHGPDRRHLVGRGWHRHHEHHAGDGHGTDPRDPASAEHWEPNAATLSGSFWWRRLPCQ